MQAKTERFEMRLEPGALDRVDAWRSQQPDLPSRAEAMRRLMESGLGASERQPLWFSDGEKLIMLMLSDVYKHLDIKGAIDPGLIEVALHGGHYWGLRWKYTGIFHDHEDNESTVSEVCDVLDMWWFLERSHEKLSKKEKDRVEKEAAPLGKDVTFRGFDGNYEGEHLGIAHFLIRTLGRFSDFQGRDLNSHMPSIDGYRRMLTLFGPMRSSLGGGNVLGPDRIIELLNAWRHDSGKR